MATKQSRPRSGSSPSKSASTSASKSPSKSSASSRSARAQLRAEQERQRQRRRRLVWVALPVALVVLVVAVLVVVKVTGVTDKPVAQAPAGGAADGVVSAVTSVPAATLDQVGAGAGVTPPKRIDGPALTADGKPRVLYVGAEYCPYCAAERWAVVVAMSRFGTFSGLGQTTSSARDVYPSTPTLSFHGSSYTSQTVAFTGVETASNELSGGRYAPLDSLSAADQQVFDTYDAPPYVDESSRGSIPFVDIGGTYMISGASFSPEVLKGLTHEQIAAALADPTSPVAQAVDGAANVITAAVCTTTQQAPATVCGSAGVQAAAKTLG